MKKNKIISIFLSFVFIFAFAVTASAAEQRTSKIYSASVYDCAEVLDQYEMQSLLEVDNEGYQTVFITMNEYIADYYTYFMDTSFDYRYGNMPEDVVYIVINFYDNWIHIEPYGKCDDFINSKQIDSILDATYSYASNGDYAEFFLQTSEALEDIYSLMGASKIKQFIAKCQLGFGNIAVALTSGIIALMALIKKHNKANEIISASKYLGGGDVLVKDIKTTFMGTTTRVDRGYYKSSSSSGGGSRSSGGGGGRHF